MKQASDVEKVLVNEIDNASDVYLYLEGNLWCAYERSAFYLAKLNVPVRLVKEIVHEGYDVVLLKAYFSVDDMCLPLAPKTELRKVADDNLQFRVKECIDGFPEWKNSQLSRFSA